MPQSIADEALLLISGRRQQREAKESKESAPLIDTVMAAKMLRLCGIGARSGDPLRLRQANKFRPVRRANNYDWEAVTKARRYASVGKVEANLTDDTPTLVHQCPVALV